MSFVISGKQMIEALAELEHEQWVQWSKEIAEKENISPDRLERWQKYWVPYKDLPESVKEQDREWALKAYQIVRNWTL